MQALARSDPDTLRHVLASLKVIRRRGHAGGLCARAPPPPHCPLKHLRQRRSSLLALLRSIPSMYTASCPARSRPSFPQDFASDSSCSAAPSVKALQAIATSSYACQPCDNDHGLLRSTCMRMHSSPRHDFNPPPGQRPHRVPLSGRTPTRCGVLRSHAVVRAVYPLLGPGRCAMIFRPTFLSLQRPATAARLKLAAVSAHGLQRWRRQWPAESCHVGSTGHSVHAV